MKLVMLAYVYWAGYPGTSRNKGYLTTQRSPKSDPRFSSVQRFAGRSIDRGYLTSRDGNYGTGRCEVGYWVTR